MGQQNIAARKSWTCKFCSHIEENIASFAKHILKHYLAQNKNLCEICDKTFGSKKNLKNHLKIVHDLNSSRPKCPKRIDPSINVISTQTGLGGPMLTDIFTDSSDLQQSELNQFDLNIDSHNLLLDNDNLTVENLIDENVKDLDHFNFEIDDNQKQNVCDICLKQFVKVKLLIVHLRLHTGDFICDKCLKIFCRKENLKTHLCNAESSFRCTLCDKKFVQKKYLTRHHEAIHRNKFICVSCNKQYHSKKDLVEHNCVEIPLGEKEVFSCSICDMTFYRELYLKRHIKSHYWEAAQMTKVTCEKCGLQVKNKRAYYKHMQKHKGKSYGCSKCGKKFSRSDYLKEHLLTHGEELQFECGSCQKRFKTKKLLARHNLVHNPNRIERKCPYCNKLFKDRSSVPRHIHKMHRNNENRMNHLECYNCPICDKMIKWKYSIPRHIKNSHGISDFDISTLQPTKMKDQTEGLRITAINEDEEKKLRDKPQATAPEARNQKTSSEVCLSIPEFGENFQEITLDKNAYILENGTIVQPQADPQKVVLYLLD